MRLGREREREKKRWKVVDWEDKYGVCIINEVHACVRVLTITWIYLLFAYSSLFSFVIVVNVVYSSVWFRNRDRQSEKEKIYIFLVSKFQNRVSVHIFLFLKKKFSSKNRGLTLMNYSWYDFRSMRWWIKFSFDPYKFESVKKKDRTIPSSSII
jgi:hypothetical protein